MALFSATGDEKIREEAITGAIPEIMRFNIVEGDIRNVC